MSKKALSVGTALIISKDNLSSLFKVLKKKGYTVIGPSVRDNTVVYTQISSPDDLPVGWGDEQDGGVYRLKKQHDKRLFGYTHAPQSWKKFLSPSVKGLWKAQRKDGGFKVIVDQEEKTHYAFIGVRACELSAILIQDKILMETEYVDSTYAERRRNAFIIAVNCVSAGGTCFCTSMGTGPKAKSGYDLAMTEIIEKKNHYFFVEVGSKKGVEIMQSVSYEKSTPEAEKLVEKLVRRAEKSMGRTLDTNGLKEVLYKNYEHPQWDIVANRCLTCGNCTMVCPTCFCTTVEDVTYLTGKTAERIRKWDSCYNLEFSYIHGGSVRPSTSARYRHWLMHKLATWYDQFGSSGCVGCGRCITWCPVGIDITEEAHSIKTTSKS